jgi:hypothetical protein
LRATRQAMCAEGPKRMHPLVMVQKQAKQIWLGCRLPTHSVPLSASASVSASTSNGCGLRLMFIIGTMSRRRPKKKMSRAETQRRKEEEKYTWSIEQRAVWRLAPRLSRSSQRQSPVVAAICAGETHACASRPEAAPTGWLSELRHGAKSPSFFLCVSATLRELLLIVLLHEPFLASSQGVLTSCRGRTRIELTNPIPAKLLADRLVERYRNPEAVRCRCRCRCRNRSRYRAFG